MLTTNNLKKLKMSFTITSKRHKLSPNKSNKRCRRTIPETNKTFLR